MPSQLNAQKSHEEMPDSPPPAYEVVYPHLATTSSNNEIVQNDPINPQSASSSSSNQHPDQMLQPKPDKLSEPRLSPAANEMIRNYNNKSSPRFPHKESPIAEDMIRSYNQQQSSTNLHSNNGQMGRQQQAKRTVVVTQQPQQVIVVQRSGRRERTTEDDVAECCCWVCAGCCVQFTLEVCCRALIWG